MRLDGEVKILIDKALHAKTPVLSHAYEDRVEELSKKRQLIAEQIAEIDVPDITEEDALGTALEFVSNPYLYWQNGDLEEKQTVLSLVFSKKPRYRKETGLGTADYSLPFRVLRDMTPANSVMVVCGVTSERRSTCLQGKILGISKINRQVLRRHLANG